MMAGFFGMGQRTSSSAKQLVDVSDSNQHSVNIINANGSSAPRSAVVATGNGNGTSVAPLGSRNGKRLLVRSTSRYKPRQQAAQENGGAEAGQEARVEASTQLMELSAAQAKDVQNASLSGAPAVVRLRMGEERHGGRDEGGQRGWGGDENGGEATQRAGRGGGGAEEGGEERAALAELEGKVRLVGRVAREPAGEAMPGGQRNWAGRLGEGDVQLWERLAGGWLIEGWGAGTERGGEAAAGTRAEGDGQGPA